MNNKNNKNNKMIKEDFLFLKEIISIKVKDFKTENNLNHIEDKTLNDKIKAAAEKNRQKRIITEVCVLNLKVIRIGSKFILALDIDSEDVLKIDREYLSGNGSEIDLLNEGDVIEVEKSGAYKLIKNKTLEAEIEQVKSVICERKMVSKL